MRCNIFKPINAGDTRMGTFFMFSQYTEDITKEQAMKSTYRVIPSKFAVVELDVDKAFNDSTIRGKFGGNGIQYDTGYGICGIPNVDVNIIIPQILQSYYENSVAFMINKYGSSWWNTEGRSYASELLWRTLEDWGFISKTHPELAKFDCYEQIKYIGDINIQSNHDIGGYSYDEIFCHIPASADEYYYPLLTPELIDVKVGDHDDYRTIEEWTNASYPVNNPLSIRAITYNIEREDSDYYHYGGDIPILKYNESDEIQPVPRNTDPDTGTLNTNSEYKFNAVIVFYDVWCSEPGGDPYMIHQCRPMGMYVSGPMKQDPEDETRVNALENTFIKYVSNNDAYGQGASFGLRIMMRYTPTPNMSTYTMEVDAGGNNYDSITQAMGELSDAIVDITESYKDQHSMYQAYKDHLSMFRNRRVNVPYPREVNGKMYWFVNGRNTGQPCQYE